MNRSNINNLKKKPSELEPFPHSVRPPTNHNQKTTYLSKDVNHEKQNTTKKPKSHQFQSRKPPYILKDGNQTTYFSHAKETAQTNLNALEHNNADYNVINIGTGKPISIQNLAENLTKLYNKPNLKPHTSNEHRKGDIRHCYADTTKAQKLLNFKPSISLQDGLTELAQWAKTHDWGATDLFDTALKKPKEKHLAI